MANTNKFTPKKYGSIGTEVLPDQTEIDTESTSIDEGHTEKAGDNQGSSDFHDEDVTMNTSEETRKPVHNVKVRTSCDHRCSIGGTWYDFKKGVQQSVPEEVKAILLNAGLLMPL